MFGNRGIYHKGWTAVTRHQTPWLIIGGEKVQAFDDDNSKSTTRSKDWSQANDLAKKMPEKLHELQRLWLIEAVRYNVLPLDDNIAARLNADTAGRPVLIKGNSQILFGSMGRLSENSVVNIKNKSHSVTAEIVVPASGAEGVDLSPGRQYRRLEPVCRGRQAEILLQPARHPPVLRGICRRAAFGSTPSSHGVRVLAGASRQGRGYCHSLRRWKASGPRQRRSHGGDGLLCRRWLRCSGVDTESPVSPDYGSTAGMSSRAR